MFQLIMLLHGVAALIVVRDLIGRQVRGHSRGTAALALLTLYFVGYCLLFERRSVHPDTASTIADRALLPLAGLALGMAVLGLVRDERRGRAALACALGGPALLMMIAAVVVGSGSPETGTFWEPPAALESVAPTAHRP